jgi:hypothetical protein
MKLGTGTIVSDTGEQPMLPKTGDLGKSQESPLFANGNAVLLNAGRSPVLLAVSARFVELYAVFFTGDAGAHGKDFGKIFWNGMAGRVALNGYGEHQQHSNGGCHE